MLITCQLKSDHMQLIEIIKSNQIFINNFQSSNVQFHVLQFKTIPATLPALSHPINCGIISPSGERGRDGIICHNHPSSHKLWDSLNIGWNATMTIRWPVVGEGKGLVHQVFCFVLISPTKRTIFTFICTYILDSDKNCIAFDNFDLFLH